MLSRVADGMFWLNRYMERADGMLLTLHTFYILSFDKVNLAVSSGSVGWHIAHSLKTIDQIVTACKHSNQVYRPLI